MESPAWLKQLETIASNATTTAYIDPRTAKKCTTIAPPTPSRIYSNAPKPATIIEQKRIGTKTPPVNWLNDSASIGGFWIDWKAQLSDDYDLNLEHTDFHLVKDETRPIALVSKKQRFFIYDPTAESDLEKLSFIQTPWNLLGLYQAFENFKDLHVVGVSKVVDEDEEVHTQSDMLVCPDKYLPEYWCNNPSSVLSQANGLDLRDHILVRWTPILTHRGPGESEFLMFQGRYYYYLPLTEHLYEIVEPEMRDVSQWSKLDYIFPGCRSFELAEVSFTQMIGGPRHLREDQVPAGWKRLPAGLDPAEHMPGFRTGYQPPPGRLITTELTNEGRVHLVEHFANVYLWFQGS